MANSKTQQPLADKKVVTPTAIYHQLSSAGRKSKPTLALTACMKERLDSQR